MKILKIKAYNINSIKEVNIDFEKFLKGSNIFAITGPTGSGKTTILDIISSSLYGETPRVKNRYSLFGKYATFASCEVEFELKGSIYRAGWSAKRIRNRVENDISNSSKKVWLYKDGVLLEDKSKNLVDRVKEIIGLEFKQFRQVMLLPQGEFNTFLKVNSSGKSEILARITGTDIYERISNRVFNRNKELELKIKNIEEEMAKKNILTLKRVKELEEERDKLSKERKIIESKLDKFRDRLAIVKDTITIENNIEDLKSRLEKFTDIERKKRIYTALEIEYFYRNVEKCSHNIKNSREELSNIENDIQKLEKKREKLNQDITSKEKELSDFKETYKDGINRASKAQKYQDKILNLERDIEYKRSILDNFKSSKVKNLNSLVKHERDVNSFNKKVDELNKEIQELEDNRSNILDNIETFQGDFKSLEELKGRAKDIENLILVVELDAEIRELKKEKIKLEERLKEKERLKSEVEENIKNLRELRDAELKIKEYEEDRKRLKEGQECFLCGSKEHPFIKENRVASPDKYQEKINKKERELKELEREINLLIRDIASKESKIESKEKRKRELSSSINLDLNYKNGDIEKLKDELTNLNNRTDKLEEEYKGLAEVEKSLQESKNNKEKISIKIESSKNSIDELESQNRELSQNILKLDYKILQLKQEKDNLKESKYKILKESDIESFKQNLETKKEAKERALKEIESKIRDIDIEMRLKKSSIKRLKETISNLEIDRDKFNSDFEKQLRERELNRDSFLALIKEKIDKRSLKNYLDEFKELNIQIKTLNRAIAPKQKEIDRFNIDNLELIELKRSLEETIVELNKNSEQSITEIKEIDNELSNNGKNLKEFEELKSKLEAIKSEYIIISKMNELIGSENGKKFSKFAQSITLNILVDLANSHLKELNPRYRLKRDSELNILIIDNFQAGVERGVNTLSGGESFLISLALSLALSDLVGKKVSINSLFLDEGFGSLDPKNLDIALETLSKLQNRGKTIGIISHIESLKERIPHHIKVIPQGGGVSKVEFK